MSWLRKRKNADNRIANQDRPRWQPWRRWTRATIDLNNPRHRRKLLLLFLIVNVLAIMFIVGNYKVYQYTESSEFCGTACHTMAPEMARYEVSPHANVECVDCHIGPGTSSFVRSKIDGLKQVYAVLTDSYSRPITSPVHNLRPARDTCETCHNPAQFKDNIIKTILHYDNDAENTPIQSTLILKMGGWQESTGMSQGIHWHITNPVYYIAADEQRQVILWVGIEQEDGSMKEYFARDMLNMAQTSFVDNAFENDEIRLMDCIDCHNRTAHYIPSPQEAVDDAIKHGLIDQNIPYIRYKAIETLLSSYNSTAEAYTTIDGLVDFYSLSYALGSNSTTGSETLLDPAIAEIKNIYSETNFPEMAQNWETNPNNARHTPSPGCFRCHDDKHISVDATGEEVEAISAKCNLCHTVPIVGRGDELIVESPVITGSAPETHADFSWTIEHRDVEGAEEQACYQCHGQAFCNNGVCHNLNHPPEMLFTHAEEYYEQGEQVCYTCHQDILCSRCHPGGIVKNP
ncbi:Cytochrome c family protein [hydrothermal vent metagenome]|uniref:Cytochrome c family protein n=1 Tax=hydrothermal vent metagenome TaxID=652676 RepID=A0A3B0WFY9_9ZZZZ